METNVEVLKRSGNFAILKFPDRAYPGIFMQGDTFHCLLAELCSNEEGRQEAIERMKQVVALYETTLKDNGFNLPYST